MKKFLSLTIFLLALSFYAFAQDTLPKFNVRNMGNKHIIINWKNNYNVVKQINIQRSADSLKNFKTIMSVTNPAIKENGYADSKPPDDKLFYRLFIVLDKGNFVFTEPKRPVLDSLIFKMISQPEMEPEVSSPSLKPDNSKTDKIDFPEKTSPTVANREISNNKPNLNVFVPSMHVYTYKDGNVRINLPETDDKKYSIKFFEEDNSFVFEIKDVKQTPVLLDKANFYHAGWFKFELYEDGKLIEKNKFKITKDF